jgi:predicted nucleotidyltransferase
MLGILESKRDLIAAACRRHGVVRLDVFGSALRDDFLPEASDLDLLVELGPMDPFARVEREFTIAGEAVSALSHAAPEIFEAITAARRIVDFHNQLTHQYRSVDDALVWAIAKRDAPVLFRERKALLQRIETAPPD